MSTTTNKQPEETIEEVIYPNLNLNKNIVCQQG